MRQRPQVWRVHNLAKTYNVRPSDLIGLSDPDDSWEAFCFDSAVATFGNKVEAELEAVEGKNKRERQRQRDAVLRKYIPELAKARKFADPGKR